MDGLTWSFRTGHSRQDQLAETPNAQAQYWFALDTLGDVVDGGDPIPNSVELSNKDNLFFDEVESHNQVVIRDDGFEY